MVSRPGCRLELDGQEGSDAEEGRGGDPKGSDPSGARQLEGKHSSPGVRAREGAATLPPCLSIIQA
jgi:hypothetical protein